MAWRFYGQWAIVAIGWLFIPLSLAVFAYSTCHWRRMARLIGKGYTLGAEADGAGRTEDSGLEGEDCLCLEQQRSD